jgi:hypothetical protein
MVEAQLGPDVFTQALHAIEDLVKALVRTRRRPSPGWDRAAATRVWRSGRGKCPATRRGRGGLVRRRRGRCARGGRGVVLEGVTDADDGVAVARAIAEPVITTSHASSIKRWPTGRRTARSHGPACRRLAADPTTKKKEEVAKAVLFALGRAKVRPVRRAIAQSICARARTPAAAHKPMKHGRVDHPRAQARRSKTPDVGDRELPGARGDLPIPIGASRSSFNTREIMSRRARRRL